MFTLLCGETALNADILGAPLFRPQNYKKVV